MNEKCVGMQVGPQKLPDAFSIWKSGFLFIKKKIVD
jgi:hypothetical protein